MLAGKFISFEGIEASGKSTQIQKLANHLKAHKQATDLFKEPGGTHLGNALRKLLMHKQLSIEPLAELMLFGAARAQLARKRIQPALDRKHCVLCDRFLDSSIAYQAWGRGLAPHIVETVNAIVAPRTPDLTFFLDLPVPLALERIKARSPKVPLPIEGAIDSFESLPADFHERVREGYLSCATAHPDRILTLDATQSPDALHQQILDSIEPHSPHD